MRRLFFEAAIYHDANNAQNSYNSQPPQVPNNCKSKDYGYRTKIHAHCSVFRQLSISIGLVLHRYITVFRFPPRVTSAYNGQTSIVKMCRRGRNRPFECAAIPWVAGGVCKFLALPNTVYKLVHLQEDGKAKYKCAYSGYPKQELPTEAW